MGVWVLWGEREICVIGLWGGEDWISDGGHTYSVLKAKTVGIKKNGWGKIEATFQFVIWSLPLSASLRYVCNCFCWIVRRFDLHRFQWLLKDFCALGRHTAFIYDCGVRTGVEMALIYTASLRAPPGLSCSSQFRISVTLLIIKVHRMAEKSCLVLSRMPWLVLKAIRVQILNFFKQMLESLGQLIWSRSC